jgi:hypothetical protein
MTHLHANGKKIMIPNNYLIYEFSDEITINLPGKSGAKSF